MAHEVESTDNVVWQFNSEPPWHGIGTELPKDTPFYEVVNVSKLNWPVSKEQMFVKIDNEFVPANDYVAILRGDTKTILGSATNQYVPFQNVQGFDSLYILIQSGKCNIETAGSIRGGKIVWVLLKLDTEEVEVKPGDKIVRYLLASWGHDGKTGISIGYVNIRAVCSNTLHMAWNNELSRLIRTSHRGTVEQNVELVVKSIDLSSQSFNATIEDYRKMVASKINANDLRNYVKLTLGIEEKPNNKKATNIIDGVVNLAYVGVGNGGGNVWSAFNSITQHLSHSSGRNQDNRMASLWFGNNSNVLRDAYDNAMKLVA